MEKKKVGRPEGKLYAKKIQLLLTEGHIQTINKAMKKGKKWKNMSDFIRYAIIYAASQAIDGQGGQNETLDHSKAGTGGQP